MITLEDCKAFCDADPHCIERLAKAKSLAPIVACAAAQTQAEPHAAPATTWPEFTGLGFRAYSTNTPEARARIVFLALLVDGELGTDELAALNTAHFLRDLGITKPVFMRVLNELCEDLAQMHRLGETVCRAHLDALFGEIRDPYDREQLLKLIRCLIRVDGHLTREESHYWQHARAAWQTRPAR